MPDWMSRERRELIRSFRAEIVGVNRQQGGFLGSIQMAEEFAANRSDVFLPRQFSNDDNSEAHYQTTGPRDLVATCSIRTGLESAPASRSEGPILIG